MNNLRYALRQLLKHSGFTIVAVLTLGLCIGANLSIFAVMDSVVLRPLPFPESDRLVTMFNTYPKAGVDRDGASLPNYYERRKNIAAFSHLSIFQYGSAIIGEAGSSEQEETLQVSPEFFDTLGLGPVKGRVFTEDETTYKTDKVAILTDVYWRQYFNADPNVVGRQIRVDGFPRTIIGVMPPSFSFLSSRARLFFPLSSNPDDRNAKQRHSGNGYELIARLQPGVSLSTAQSQIDAHNAAHAEEYPRARMIADAGFRTVVTPLREDHVRSVRPTLILLQAGGLFLLLIGGVNLVNLLLIRAGASSRELAIRQSLGANRRHLVVQVATETILLTVIGGIVGLVIGAGGIRLLGILGVNQLPLGAHVAFDTRLAIVALIASVALGTLITVPIAWFSLHRRLAHALQSESRVGTSGRAAQRLRHGFIVAQIAMAFVLLTGAAMLGISLKNILSVRTGFREDHVLTGRISLPWNSYSDSRRRIAFVNQILEEAGHQPGVSAAGVINNVPFSGRTGKSAITIKGHVFKPGETLQGHYRYVVGGDAMAALGIPLREGRLITGNDSEERICVVDEDFARRYWPSGGAIGHFLFSSGSEGPDSEAFTIAGVVGAVKQAGLTEGQGQGAVYFPYRHRPDGSMFAVVRTIQKPEELGLILQKIVRTLDPELPVIDIRSMEDRISDSLVVRSSPALLAGVFAAVALALAAVGTYGVLAFAVNQRRREIGVRLALGALPSQVGAQFLSLGLRLLAVGALIGVFGAMVAGHAMQSILFGVPGVHPAALFGAAMVMALASLAASWLPARRAARVDPMVILRTE